MILKNQYRPFFVSTKNSKAIRGPGFRGGEALSSLSLGPNSSSLRRRFFHGPPLEGRGWVILDQSRINLEKKVIMHTDVKRTRKGLDDF